MAKYKVTAITDQTVTISATIEVEADSDIQAMDIVDGMIETGDTLEWDWREINRTDDDCYAESAELI